jgi:hypothetical protein
METGKVLLQNDTYVSSLAQALASGQSLANVPGLVKNIIKSEMWRDRIVRQTGKQATFKRFRDFVEAYPPEGLHTTIPMLIQICTTYDDMEAVSMIAQAEAGERGNPTGNNQYTNSGNINNVNVSTRQETSAGNSTPYTMRRLAKDAPELHKAVVSGDLSPNAAALQAGFRRRKFQMPDTPEAAGKYLAERVDVEWFMAMVDSYYRHIEE